MTKKIAVIFNKLEENTYSSGGNKVNYLILKALYELGYDVDVFCRKTNLQSCKYAKNIFVKPYKNMEKINRDDYLFIFGENNYPCDILYIHENTRFFREKYVRTNFEKFVRSIFSRKRNRKLKRYITSQRNLLQNTNIILCPSTFIKADLKEAGEINEKKIKILPPPLENFDKNHFIPEKHKKFTFGLSARGFENKGGYFIILAAFLLKLFTKNFKVIIIYPFSNSSNLLGLILKIFMLDKNIEFTDFCENMDNFYKRIDCLVMASKREAWGLVAMEAMQRNIPVIVNTRCGIKDIILDNKTGFVYDFKNPVFNLFKKMKYVMNHTHKLSNIAENARQNIDRLSYENFKANLKNIIEEYTQKC